ncbi:hypothetical protein AGLY_002191 [Aphis glycines]|uniref:Uncharacterized protein n=1 Tax=Aphis glycines TaxID=307491 RepID=A0A6G0U2P7_APHGL|nr:hypothetical protein AGLY_002191 [Aphis glycines]
MCSMRHGANEFVEPVQLECLDSRVRDYHSPCNFIKPILFVQHCNYFQLLLCFIYNYMSISNHLVMTSACIKKRFYFNSPINFQAKHNFFVIIMLYPTLVIGHHRNNDVTLSSMKVINNVVYGIIPPEKKKTARNCLHKQNANFDPKWKQAIVVLLSATHVTKRINYYGTIENYVIKYKIQVIFLLTSNFSTRHLNVLLCNSLNLILCLNDNRNPHIQYGTHPSKCGIVATGLWLNRFELVEGVSCQHTVQYCGLGHSGRIVEIKHQNNINAAHAAVAMTYAKLVVR